LLSNPFHGARDEKVREDTVSTERLLGVHAFFATHAAVNDNHRLRATQQRGDTRFEVAQGVAVLSENNELLTWRRLRSRNGAGFKGGIFAHAIVSLRGAAKISPNRLASSFHLRILPAATNGECERSKAT
jgi:hypothetical protein